MSSGSGKSKGEDSSGSDDDANAIIPTSSDVLLGRGREISTWEGNKRYLVEIERNTERYRDAPTRAERVQIILGIIEQVKTWGRFLDQPHSNGKWYLANITKTRKKVGQALRYQMEQAKYNPSRRQSSASRRRSSATAPAASRAVGAATRSTSTNHPADLLSSISFPADAGIGSSQQESSITSSSATGATVSEAVRRIASTENSPFPGSHATATPAAASKGGGGSSSDEKDKSTSSSESSSLGIPIGAYGEETQPPLLDDGQILSSVGVAVGQRRRQQSQENKDDEVDRKMPAQDRMSPQQESLLQDFALIDQEQEGDESRKRPSLITDQDLLSSLLEDEGGVTDGSQTGRKKKKTESPI